MPAERGKRQSGLEGRDAFEIKEQSLSQIDDKRAENKENIERKES